MSKTKRYKLATLGCRTNQYESQAYADQLSSLGYKEAKEGESADICIVNTCTVTENADKKSLYQIRKLAKENRGSKLLVTGCLAEREKKKIEALDGVDFVIPNKDKETLLSNVITDDLPEFSIKRFEAHTRAFVKIQDGCNSYCSYCIIPFVRGRSRSKTLSQIVSEIQSLVENGYREVVLTGINIGDFDGNVSPPKRLSDLIYAIDDIKGLERIRISSIDPDEVDDDLIDAINSAKHTCGSMHLVLQAGSNLTLKKMNRKYTKKDFFYAANRLLVANPDFTFTTDVIVGFPGETEEDFLETMDVVKKVRFSKVHIFPYSDRPKTRASRMPDKIDSSLMTERKKRLLVHAQQTAQRLREEYVGKSMKVLLEGLDPKRDGYITGHTDNFLEVSIPKGGFRSNDIVNVKLISNEPDVLLGKICE